MKKIVSFDYDGTLTRKDVFDFANTLKEDYELWLITSRYHLLVEDNSYNNEVFITAYLLGIPNERIIFTEHQWKYTFIKNMKKQPIIHFDDYNIEINKINVHTNCIGLSVLKNYKTKFDRLK